jgi:hypothetical protein
MPQWTWQNFVVTLNALRPISRTVGMTVIGPTYFMTKTTRPNIPDVTPESGTLYLMTGATSGAGTPHPSGEHEFTPGF